MAVPRTFVYKVYRAGRYLGDLPNVNSEFGYPQDVNSAGTQLIVKMGMSPDVSGLPPSVITTEADEWIVDETGVYAVTTEAADDVVGDSNDNILIRNGNKLKVWMFDEYYPNGLLRFSGQIEKWPAKFAAVGADEVGIVAYSDGQDLNEHVIPGSNSLFVDQSQPLSSGTGATFAYLGQNLVTGGTVTNIAAIDVKLEVVGSPDVTCSLYATSLSDRLAASSIGIPIASVTKTLSATTPASGVFQFVFATPITAPPNTSYSFVISDPNYPAHAGGVYSSIGPDFQSSGSTYSGGSSFLTSLSGGVVQWRDTTALSGVSAYFKTYFSDHTTTAVFPAQDPSTMLMTVADSYIAQGGLVTYTVDSIDMTGLSVPYDFSLATTYEGIAKAKDLSPSDFYWYVDVGSNLLYFKRTSATADIILQKGVHVGELDPVGTIENVKNFLYFSGGDIGGGVNLFKTYSDPESIAKYGIRIERMSDNRVTQVATADAIGEAFIAARKDEQHETTVTVSAATMDITLCKPGKTVGFRGYGNFIDQLLTQISHLDVASDSVTLMLGAMPPRTSVTLQQALANITALQTIANPNAPS